MTIYYIFIDIGAKQRDSFWFFRTNEDPHARGLAYTWLPRTLRLGREEMKKPGWAHTKATNEELHLLIHCIWKANQIEEHT